MSDEDLQLGFDLGVSENDPDEFWKGMPAYDNIIIPPPAMTATFYFKNKEDFDEFHRLIKKHVFQTKNKLFDGNQKKDVKTEWYPLRERPSAYRYEDEAE